MSTERSQDDVRDEIRANLSRMENTVLATLQSLFDSANPADHRWLSIARTHIEQGFMAAKRAVYEGKRVGDP